MTPLIIALAVATSGAAQTPPPLLQRVAWNLADFVVLGDSTHGVQLLASPNLRTERGRGGVEMTTLSLDPAVAHHWATGVARILDSLSQLPPVEWTVFETVPLAANRSQGHILIAFDGKGSQKQPFAFVVRDGATAWWLPVSDADLRQLFGALATIASRSALAPAPIGQNVRLACQLDERPQLLDPMRLKHPDRNTASVRDARVLAQYVIDTAGVVQPGSVQILLSDGKDFTREAQGALARARYRPGRAGGQPVATIVWQWFLFKVVR